MRLLVFGSIYARDIKNRHPTNSLEIAGNNIDITYRCYPGKSYEFFLQNPHLIDAVLACVPDFVITIFGGNSITINTSKSYLVNTCKSFYQLLFDKLKIINPNALIISHQIPLRFVFNQFKDTPKPEDFKKLRDHLNEKVRKLATVHHILLIAGPNRLDHIDCFRHERNSRNRIHFTTDSIDYQYNRIVSKIEYILTGN